MQTSRKFFICVTLSLLTLLWASPADAQQRSKWWKSERFTKELSLTADQSARIEEIFQAAEPALRAQNRALQKLEDELSAMIAEARVGEPELEHFVTRVEAARADLSKVRTMMIYRIRRVLRHDQHTKLQRLFEEDEKARRGKGHGSS